MAGQTPGRKQWRILREPIENIQSLGLAEDGCPESQVILAKHLLEQNCDDRVNQEEKARLGVYWLIKASEKGHQEATKMLQECLETGRGISEHNVDDVRTCLNMTQGEKVSREAARELFSRLSQGEDFVTSGQIIEEMRRCSRESSSIDSETDGAGDWRHRQDENGQKLTEEMLVMAASNHSRGELPLVLKLPLVESSLIRMAVARIAELPTAPRPVPLLLCLSLFSIDTLIDMAPSLLYYASLFLMVLTTCQVLTKKWEFNQFRQWSNLLVAWGCPETNSVNAEWSHCWHNARPCLLFLIALLVNLLVTPFVPSLAYSEITVLSTVMSLVTLYNFAWYKKKFDFLIIVSFVVHLLARYPYEIDTVVSQYWRYLDVHTPTFASFIVGNSIEFCLNFRVLFYLMMPGILIKVAGRDRWLGIFTTLLPHLVCLSWWQNAVLASNGVTQYGLIRACLAVVGLLLFLPLAGFIAVIIPIAALARFVSIQQVSTPFALTAASFITVIYMGTKSRRAGKLFSWIQVFLCIISIWIVMNSTENDPANEIGLDWREYSEICRGNSIEQQEACSSLTGVRVSWEGRFLSSRLASVHNPIAPVVQRLPQSVQEVVTCMWGERFARNVSSHAPSSLGDKCHLANWNKYEYEIEVELGPGDSWVSEKMTGLLIGGHNFRNLSVSLKHGDRMWFTGLLTQPLLEGPRISLLNADCLSCKPLDSTSPPDPTPLNLFVHIIFKPLFNFIFNPMAVLR